MMKVRSFPYPAFCRFVVSGGLNTVVTYVLYIGMLPFVSYHVSYTTAYVAGIVLSYALNRAFVFRSHRGIFSVILLPVVYVIQYGLNIILLWLLVSKANMHVAAAPLVIVAITIPVTFSLSKFVFRTGEENKFDSRTS